MAVTVVLADGFAGEGVELVADGRTYAVDPARTSLLTGMAGEVIVNDIADGQSDGQSDGQPEATGSGQIQVTARLTRASATSPADEAHTDTPWASYRLAQGDVLVLDLVGGQLNGRVMPGPVGFA